MSVYVITCRDLGVAKIGYSNDPLRRASFLRTGSPSPVKLEAVIPADERNERQLHKVYSDHRAHGEWFNLCPSIEGLIEKFQIGTRRRFAGIRAADLVTAVGISQAYASMILTGKRRPPASLAIKIYRETGWRHEIIADASDSDMEAHARIDPWKLQTPLARAA